MNNRGDPAAFWGGCGLLLRPIRVEIQTCGNLSPCWWPQIGMPASSLCAVSDRMAAPAGRAQAGSVSRFSALS